MRPRGRARESFLIAWNSYLRPSSLRQLPAGEGLLLRVAVKTLGYGNTRSVGNRPGRPPATRTQPEKHQVIRDQKEPCDLCLDISIKSRGVVVKNGRMSRW
jgi:hypothetical protein